MRQRVNSLAKSGGFEIVRVYCTPPIVNAAMVESTFIANHHNRRLNGEWFRMDGGMAKVFVETVPWMRDNRRKAELYKRSEDGKVAAVASLFREFNDAHAALRA